MNFVKNTYFQRLQDYHEAHEKYSTITHISIIEKIIEYYDKNEELECPYKIKKLEWDPIM